MVKKIGYLIIFSSLCLVSVKAQEGNPSEKSSQVKKKREISIELPEIEVHSPTLSKEKVFDIPYKVDIIDRDDFNYSVARNTPNYLKFIPNINVQETAFGHGSPFIRGLTGFRNVYLIDGIRLNNSFFREGPNQYFNTIDGYLVESIEVVKGPVSVLYGSDAIGGVVAVTTIEPMPVKGIHERTSLYFSSASSTFQERQEIHYRRGRFSFYLGGTLKHFNDLRGGKNTGLQPMTGFAEDDADTKFIYRISDNTKLIFAYQHLFQNNVPRTHRTKFARPFRDTTIGTDKIAIFDQWRDLFYIQYHQENPGSFFNELHTNISYHRQKETFFRIDKNDKQEFRWANIETVGNWLYFISQTTIGKLIYGYDIYYDIVNSRGVDTDNAGNQTFYARGEVPDDANYLLGGLFIQNEYDLMTRLKSITGVRLQYVKASAERVDPNPLGTNPALGPFKRDFFHFVPSQRFSYLISDNLNLIFGISGGFRAPTFDDLAAVRLVLSGQTDLPSPNLDPEKSWNFEIGVKYKSSRIYISAFYFYNLLQDLIRRVPNPNQQGTFVKSNFASGFIQGFEIDWEYNFYKKFYLVGNFGFLDSSADALSGNTIIRAPLDKIQPTTLHLGFEYRGENYGGVIYLTAIDKKSPSQYSPSDKKDTQRIPPSGLPGIVLFDLSAYYKIKENIKVSLSIENLFNRDYRIFGSGQNIAGFNTILKVDISF
ncbi:MAG: TonB-dependent receptor plug domain-containing protein [Planctomycetota bacterium]